MTRNESIDFLECRRAYYASLSTDPNPYVKATKVCGYTLAESANACLMAIEALEQESCEGMGEVSDGYHTFNQLYYQRAVLFATIVNLNKDKAWKSFKHSDGKYCFDSNGEWFIVGVDTPQGSYTYHYEERYWDMFDCEELECGKEWDGHTEEDVTRLLSLQQQPCDDCISRQAVIDACDQSINLWEAVNRIEELKPVTPQYTDVEIQKMQEMEQAEIQKAYKLEKTSQLKVGHCKDCKHWKDSDGTYRRDINAESKCPMNRKEVYEGTGYCFLFESKMESEG